MMHVYYAVGHGIQPNGRHDPGAVSQDGRWNEQTAGDRIVSAAAAASRGAGLIVTDEADRDDPNYVGTARDANAANVDALVTIHHDWNGAPSGSFVHWFPGSDEGKRLADAILHELREAGLPIRGDWHRARDLYVLRHTRAPAVLVEVGRIGQAELDTRAELEAVGVAVARGVHRWAGVREGWPALTTDEALDQLFELAQLDYGTRRDPTDLGRLVGVLRAELGG